VTTGHTGHPPYYPLYLSIKHVDLGLCYDEPGALSRFTVYRRNKPKYRRYKGKLEKLFSEIRPDIAIAAG